MRHRPKRKNYDRGSFGEIAYTESLEKYCTYLENLQKKKLLIVECEYGDEVIQLPVFAANEELAYNKIKRQFPDYKPMIIDSDIDLSFACR